MLRRTFLGGLAASLLATTALAGPYGRALGPVNGPPPAGFPSMWGPQASDVQNVSPDQIPGLVFAIRPDQGLTLSGTDITAVAPAWGTSIGATGAAGTTAPQKAAGFGPGGKDLFSFASASTQFFSLASTVTLATSCTVFWMHAPTIFATNKAIFAANPGTCYIRTLGVAGSTQGVWSVQTVGGANVNITITNGPYRNVLPMSLTYDSAAAGGTVNIYVNNVLAGSATGVGTGGFAFNRIGVFGGVSLPYDGYQGPSLAYSRVLTATERAQLHNYFKPWRGQNIYVASAGSDVSVTPWNSTTPLQTCAIAAGLPLQGFETLAPKGGDVFRFTNQLACTVPGFSSSERMSWDGSVWGTGKAQFRSSTAPAVTLVSGTVYDCGAFGSSPTYYVHYIPGGVIAFGPNKTLGSMQRMTEDVSTPGTPAVGKWGYTGGKVFVNAGVALSTGDIEVTLSGSAGIINANIANWNFNNIIILFPAATAMSGRADNQTYNNMEAYFGTQDGFDGSGPFVGTMYYNNCIVGYMGSGPVGTGSAFGDGFSHHAGAVATHTNCQAWYNDKGGFNHIGSCTITNVNCISVGSIPYRISNSAGGSLTLINCVGVVTVDAVSIDCVRNDATANPLVVENCTLASLKDPATGASGIIQFNAGGSITAKNNIITGFATGLNWQGSGALDADYNDMFANSAGYAGTTAGVNDLAVDPLFVSAAALNYALQSSSPVKGRGFFIPAIQADIVGTTRHNPPSLGAYE